MLCGLQTKRKQEDVDKKIEDVVEALYEKAKRKKTYFNPIKVMEVHQKVRVVIGQEQKDTVEGRDRHST